jgi:exosortase
MTISASDNSTPWTPRRLALAAVCVAAAVLAMGSAWGDWYGIASLNEEYSHVFLVLPFAAVILYVNRREFAGVRGGPSWVGPAIVAAGWLTAWWGYHYAHQSMWHAGAIAVAVGAMVSVLGHGVVLRFWPVFLMLAFMVPLSNQSRLRIAEPLQAVMAAIVQKVLSAFGEDIGRQGNLLTVNGQGVLVGEACNGLRMVFSLILVNWLFAFVTPLKPWVRLLVIALGPVTALVCNVIRLIPTLLLYGHASQTAADRFHDWAGWAMVGVAFGFLILLMSLIEALGFEVRRDGGGKDDDGTPSGGQPAEGPAAREVAAAI